MCVLVFWKPCRVTLTSFCTLVIDTLLQFHCFSSYFETSFKNFRTKKSRWKLVADICERVLDAGWKNPNRWEICLVKRFLIVCTRETKFKCPVLIGFQTFGLIKHIFGYRLARKIILKNYIADKCFFAAEKRKIVCSCSVVFIIFSVRKAQAKTRFSWDAIRLLRILDQKRYTRCTVPSTGQNLAWILSRTAIQGVVWAICWVW